MEGHGPNQSWAGRMAQDEDMTVGVTSLVTIFPCSGCDSCGDTLSVHRGFDFTIQDARESQPSHKTSVWLGKISSIIQNALTEQSILQNTEVRAQEQKPVTLCSDKERGQGLAA